MHNKPNYGIDAPGVIRNLYIAGAASFVLAVLVAYVKLGSLEIQPSAFISMGISLMLPATLMLVYSLYGKYTYRDKLLNQINWSGDEQVLDIGTGKGLLMIGAAKKLTTGKAYGIDIWNKEDLTGNDVSNALQNASLEGVSENIEIRNENAMNMGFPDAFFDVVVSNLCLHNIYDRAGREIACKEIFRVLKPGGKVIISDFKHTGEYRDVFTKLGMITAKPSTSWFGTFPPLTMVSAIKQ